METETDQVEVAGWISADDGDAIIIWFAGGKRNFYSLLNPIHNMALRRLLQACGCRKEDSEPLGPALNNLIGQKINAIYVQT